MSPFGFRAPVAEFDTRSPRRSDYLDSLLSSRKRKMDGLSESTDCSASVVAEAVNDNFDGLILEESNANVPVLPSQTIGNRSVPWKSKSYRTVSGSSSATEVGKTSVSSQSGSSGSDLLENFTVENSTYCHAQIRATFYPKFENEKTDQEIRARMIEIVSKGLATLEVSLKHSGSLFMYAGRSGGAYAKNSFGNIYPAVGVFVLSRMFREAWGTKAVEKESKFSDFLEKSRMCISMELVTAVLGDHGQRPLDDYVVVTAVTELGNGKPKFSIRKSVASFFAVFDALCEEGIATSVCSALDEVADISVTGSKDHVKVQGEILEGLVARIVSSQSATDMKNVLKDHPPPPCDGDALSYHSNFDLGLSLREICAAHRSNEKEQIRALLRSAGTSVRPSELEWFLGESHPENAEKSVITKFLQSQPADYSTSKLQEMVRLIKEKRFPTAFKFYHNYHRANEVSPDNLFYKLVVHVHSDSGFKRYQKEMRHMPTLWPLYRGFFVGINLFKSNKRRNLMALNNSVKDGSENSGQQGKTDLADDDANLMIKLKFLPYKLRTFLIRNGLSILFKEGLASYKAYYFRQMKSWGTSDGKQKEVGKMLDEWAAYTITEYGNKQLSSSTYLSEAEPFLEQYAKRSPKNQVLIGSTGNLVRTEDFLAIVDGDLDEEGDIVKKETVTPVTPESTVKEAVQKAQGLIVFFPGIPGCAKSTLCKQLLNTPGGFGDDRPVYTLMGDLVKGKYWPKVVDALRKKPESIMLADKNAPNEDVWRQIEDMCRKTRVSAVPIVTDSEGTESNPYSLDALAVFMFRVLQRVNHPAIFSFIRNEYIQGKLDKASSNAGYVLLMFYHFYEGKVPFESVVHKVREELKRIAKSEYEPPSSEKTKYGSIVFAAINLPATQHSLLEEVAAANPAVRSYLEGKKKTIEERLERSHVTLAYKRSHGVAAVASYGEHLNREVPVEFTELIYNDRIAARTAHVGTVEGETIVVKNEWPHVTMWTAEGVTAKEANTLPQLYLEGRASRVEIDPPVSISGQLEFF